ncbi:MAG: MarR family transcriptional regulator [Muricomes sp.]
MKNNTETINRIREFNRFYTVILGILNRNFLGTDYSLTETRILFELQSNFQNTANSLIEKLQIDKSYMSRILKSFEKKGFITKQVVSEDKRSYKIQLTQKGKDKTSELIEVTNRQIEGLVESLTSSECDEVIGAMDTITKYLSKNL